MHLINRTPHAITWAPAADAPLSATVTWLPDETSPPARVSSDVHEPEESVLRVTVDGAEVALPTIDKQRASPSWPRHIPRQPELGDAAYIVSLVVLQWLDEHLPPEAPARRHFVAPDTGPHSAMRDLSGRIVAVRRFLTLQCGS